VSPSASAHTAATARSLEALTLVELAERVRHAGVADALNQNESGDALQFRTVTWNHTANGRGDSWIVRVAALSAYGAPAAPTDDERRAALSLAIQSYDATGYAGTYGVGAASIAVVQTSATAGATALFDAVFVDVPLVARGILTVAHAPGSPTNDDGGPPATRLRELGADALASRLRSQGMTVTGVWGGTFDSAIVVFGGGKTFATANLTRTDAKRVLTGYAISHQAITYAQDGETLVVLVGDTSVPKKQLLGAVLAGLGAKVQEQL
jgi:hypothetical protein